MAMTFCQRDAGYRPKLSTAISDCGSCVDMYEARREMAGDLDLTPQNDAWEQTPQDIIPVIDSCRGLCVETERSSRRRLQPEVGRFL